MNTEYTNRYCRFKEEPDATLKSIFGPGPIEYAVHLEMLSDIKITRFRYVEMTDEFMLKAIYKGFELSIDMDWGGALNLTASSIVPEEIFSEVCGHMKNYNGLNPIKFILARRRYAKIAKQCT